MSNTDTRQFTLTSSTGEVIAHGSLNAVMEHLPDTHARDAALESMLRTAADAVEAEQRQQEAYASAAQMISDTVAHLTSRLAAYLTRREDQRRRDAERAEREEQEEIQRTLDALPDPDNPDAPDTHIPTGDLHELPPSEDPTGDATPLEEDDQGLTGVIATRPITDPSELGGVPDPKQVSQPIAISLNEE
jgi:hypothetical protein